jgi:hypothetical protein
MPNFQLSAAFRASMDQLREGGLASVFLALISLMTCIALIVILSFGFFGGIDMFDASQTGIGDELGAVAILAFTVFVGIAYCAGTMAIFRHAVDGYRADFVTSLGYGWKASLPVLGVMFLLYLLFALLIMIIVFASAALMGGGLDSGIFDALATSDFGVGMIALAIILYLLLFIIVGLFIPARLGLAGPIMAAHQRLNPFWAMGQSWAMTRGNSFKLMGYLLLIVLAWIILYALVGFLNVTLVSSGFYYADFITSYPFLLAYMILYNFIITGIYYQLSGGALIGSEQIDEVFG